MRISTTVAAQPTDPHPRSRRERRTALDRPVRVPHRLPLRRKLFFTLALGAIFLAVGETAARVWLHRIAAPSEYPKYALSSEFPTAAKYAPHHYLCYGLQPGYRRGAVTHNSLGYRGPEIAVPKPAGTFRIVAIGGSTTYTEFVDDDAKTFPGQLQRILRRRLDDDRIEVVNAGCPGYNSWESLANLAFRVLDLEPDLLIIYHGVNDVHARLVEPSAYRGDNSGRRTVWTEPLDVRLLRHSCLARIVGHRLGLWRSPGVDSYVRAATCDPGADGPSTRFGGDPRATLRRNRPVFFRRNLRNMVALAHAHGARVLLATWASSPRMGDYVATEHYGQGIDENNRVVHEVAQACGSLFFDFAADMPTDPILWRDGRHVNEAGALRKAELFADFLLERAAVPTIAARSTTGS